MKLYIILISILLVGCTTTQPQQQQQINCPTCVCNTPTEESAFIYFINVGQGDSELIKYNDTEMLIDCGPNSAGPTVVDYLKAKGVTRLEFLMITHLQSDHLGGCDDVLKSINTHTVIMNGETSDSSSYKEIMDLIDTEELIIANEGKELPLGPVSIKIIQSGNEFEDSNQNSIVAMFQYGVTKVLFTGDCDKQCEDRLLNKDITADILKVAHHGTKFATEIDFLERVNPSLAVIPVGENSYGHPTQETLDRLSQEGVNIFRTDLDKDVGIKIDKNGYVVIE